MGPRRAKMGQDRPKIGPRRAKIGPRWGQDGPRWGQDGAKTGQDGAKMGQDGAKIGPRWANIGPRWAQDVAKAQVAKNSKNPRVSGDCGGDGRPSFCFAEAEATLSGCHGLWGSTPLAGFKG